jgi:hypothetical protein
MASDLSNIIQDGLSSTLNGLLAKDTKLIETTKVHEKDIEDLEVLQVNAIFDFEKISSTFSFIIPAVSSSYIFNTMMGDTQAEAMTTIDDDTKDAMEEFVSNLSGGLTTAINGAGFEDLGGVKFNIAKSQIIKGDTLKPYENIFRFLLDLEEYQLIIFIKFDKVIEPYVETILKSPITVHAEPEPEPEPKKEEPVKEESKPESKPEPKKEESKPEPKKDEQKQEDDPKAKKLKLIIMGVGGLLGLVLISGIIMYFMGVFDEPEPKPEPKKDVKKVVKKDEIDVVQYKTLKKTNFKPSDINEQRLNGRLAILSKASVLSPKELTRELQDEKKRLEKLNIEKQYQEFAKLNKEEPLSNSISKKPDTKIKKVVTKATKQENTKKQQDEEFTYIVTSSLQYKLFTTLLTKINTKTAIASICSDDMGETAVYIGYFELNSNLEKMEDLIKQSDINIEFKRLTITKQEFYNYCN